MLLFNHVLYEKQPKAVVGKDSRKSKPWSALYNYFKHT